MIMLLNYGIIALINSLFMVSLFKFVAFKTGIVDVPDGKIKNHAITTPYLGGFAIISAIIITFIAISFFENSLEINFYKKYLIPILCLLLLAVLGLVDDIFVITPFQKILGQSLVSIAFIFFGFYLNYSSVHLFFLYSITFFWFLIINNALNLIDIMDGLAGTVSLIALLFFSFWSFLNKNINIASASIILIGALIGFLFNNKPKATIYLGDSGALFLGGVLSIFPFIFYINNKESNIHIFIATAILLAFPLIETLFLIIIRTYYKIPFYKASPHHFIFYLRNKKWTDLQILIFVAFFNFIFGLLATAFLWNIFPFFATFLTFSFLFFLYTYVVYYF